MVTPSCNNTPLLIDMLLALIRVTHTYNVYNLIVFFFNPKGYKL